MRPKTKKRKSDREVYDRGRNIAFSERLILALESKAAEEETSVNAIVRRAVVQYLGVV